MTKPHILIAGAGLGGLTAAIALTLRGFEVDLFEQAPELKEVGAGLTVSRAAALVMREIEVQDQVMAMASWTKDMVFAHYRNARILTGVPDHGDGSTPRGGIHIHRADMHAILAARFAELAPGKLHLGYRLEDFRDAEGPVELHFSNGKTASGDLLIGADGIRSAIRSRLWGDGAPVFTGQVAFRFMMPGDVAAPYLVELGRAAVYQGPGRIFNRYTLRRGELVNCVGITQSDLWKGEGWSEPANRDEMLALYADWHPDVRALMERAPEDNLVKWGLFSRSPLPGWQRGRITLLGDAAHPMLPFLGLGAAMAIEDAMVLARALEASPDTQGLAIYERSRSKRATQIGRLSAHQGQLLQARDPDNYDASTAPAHDQSIQEYDPVTVPLSVA
jgi:salicylate hydroxylase